MNLLSVHRPRIGVKIGTKTLSLMRTESSRPDWERARPRRRCDRPTPPGLVRVSATASNLADPAALAAELRALRRELPDAGRPGEPVALDLPDLCARVALLDFDRLPVEPAERQALLSWRLRDTVHLPAAPTRLVYRIFRRADAPGGRGGLRVLTVALLESVLADYERACLEADLLPVSVGLNSLQLFDRCRPAMSRAQGRMEEQLFLALNEDSFGFIGVRQGCPVMVRLKPWRPEDHTGSLPDELIATMQFYAEVVPELLGSGPRPLFAAEAAPGAEGLTAAHMLPPATAEVLGIHVIPLDRDGLPPGVPHLQDAPAAEAPRHRSPADAAGLRRASFTASAVVHRR